MSHYFDRYPEISEKLKLVLNKINEINKSSEEFLNESVDYLLSTGGKMLRPAFLLIGSMFGDERNDDKICTLAAAVESLHLATLIHDDIIDEAELRRGKQTIASKYSKTYAVYMGDYLFSKCFVELANQDVDPKVLKRVAEGVSKICTGELLQNKLRYNYRVGIRDYLRVVRGKTAALFAVSLGTGAKESGASDAVSKRLTRIGLYIGMAFQIIDDLFDYIGDAITVGKEVMVDLSKGYYTLPLLLALDSPYRNQIVEILDKNEILPTDINNVVQLVKESGAIDKAKYIAKQYTTKALSAIETLPDGQGKAYLKEIVPALLQRVF